MRYPQALEAAPLPARCGAHPWLSGRMPTYALSVRGSAARMRYARGEDAPQVENMLAIKGARNGQIPSCWARLRADY